VSELVQPSLKGPVISARFAGPAELEGPHGEY